MTVQMQPLPPDRLAHALSALPAWRLEHDSLVRTYRCTSFREAIDFMQDCVTAIERLDHHPTWTNSGATVHVRLTTHSVGNRVTSTDVELAKTLDWISTTRSAPVD
jgi:4a-hydroxytetrahydrobiopterin dehydratase